MCQNSDYEKLDWDKNLGCSDAVQKRAWFCLNKQDFKRHQPLSPFKMTKRVLPSYWKNWKFLMDWFANAKYSYSCLESSPIHSQCYVYHVNNCLYLHWCVMIHHTICALHIQRCIKAVEIRTRPEFANLSSHTASSFIAISHLIWNKHVPWKKSNLNVCFMKLLTIYTYPSMTWDHIPMDIFQTHSMKRHISILMLTLLKHVCRIEKRACKILN